MLILFLPLVGVPLVGILQAIFWPEAFAHYGSFPGRFLFVVVLLGYIAILGFIYWMRFLTMSPVSLRLAHAKMCYIGVWVGFFSPIGLFGLSQFKLKIFDSVVVDFGDAAIDLPR
jgi:hypothetical protein